MLAEVGSICIGVALTTVAYAIFAAFWSLRRGDPRWAESGRHGMYASTVLLGGALLVLLVAFLGDQFQIRYVAQHSSRALPLHLKASAVWAGQDGSLLLWSFLQALFAALTTGRRSDQSQPLFQWAAVFLSLITAFFVAVTLFLSNPFVRLESVPLDGQGLNPLLRHPGMIFHPPATYVGYVGLAVPFAFALAALVTRRVEKWPAVARRWTLVAWLFLGWGIMLGARWAYDVLGWGGYWGWDPVENAGLMPWLSATALLHGMVMQEQRGGFRWWNVLLATLSFTLVLFGTFTTRSGLILSVHAFARSGLGPHFLAASVLTLGGSLALMLSRRSILADPLPVQGVFSRDGLFLLTLVLLLTITASIFIGSLLPTLTESLLGQRLEAGPEWFDQVTGPQFAVLVFLMGVCPLLGVAASSAKRSAAEGPRGPGERGLFGLLGAALLTTGAALAGFTRPVSLIAFALIGLAGATTLAEFGRGIVIRSRRGREGPLKAMWHLLRRNRRKYGGYLVHMGVILLALGVVGTRMYAFERDLVLSRDEPTAVGEYTLVYRILHQDSLGDHVSTRASISVYRNDAYLTTLHPRADQYPALEQMVARPAVQTRLREDVYLILAGWAEDGTQATLKLFVNPLVSFLWGGGLFLLFGGLVALWPQARVARLPASVARRRKFGLAAGLAVGLLTLVVAGVAMWVNGGAPSEWRLWRNDGAPSEWRLGQDNGESAVPLSQRPLSGQPAPTFALELLDGSDVTLSELRGHVVVVNFWGTWCSTCEEQLPLLQTVWSEYREREVVFIGISFRSEEDQVRETAARFGLTYPLGLDQEGRFSADYGITGVPETFVVDAEGRVAYVHVGPVSAGRLRRELERLLDG